ncbi:hypothetical protein RR48_02965 [Papilio machaon]|uniref:Uncharacterized protein n=1 Tax=Papilio machaon TaxID=76193 RepID=A0A0N1I620_PAPMA|nr:hypothetical protein RR48_02965 [Papilio machaon]
MFAWRGRVVAGLEVRGKGSALISRTRRIPHFSVPNSNTAVANSCPPSPQQRGTHISTHTDKKLQVLWDLLRRNRDTGPGTGSRHVIVHN